MVECENGGVESWLLQLPPFSYPAPVFPDPRPLNSAFPWIYLLFTDKYKCLGILDIDKY